MAAFQSAVPRTDARVSIDEAAPGDRLALLRRIADPKSVGWAGFWASLAVGLLLQWLGALTLAKTDALLTRTWLLIATQILMYALLLVTVRPLLARRWMRGRWVLTLFLFAVAGLLRQALFGMILDRLGLPPLQPVAGRFLSAMLTVAMAMGFAAVLSSLVRESSRRRETLLQEQDHLRHLRSDVTTSLLAAHEETVRDVRAELVATFQELPLSETDKASSSLLETADTIVRPLSHDLAGRVPDGPAPPELLRNSAISWRDTLRGAAREFTWSPGITALVGLLLTMLLSGVYGPRLTTVLSVANALGTWLILLGLTKALQATGWQRHVSRRPWLGVLLVLLTQVPLQALLLVTFTSSTPYPYSLAAGAFLFWPVIAYTISLAANLLTQQEQINNDLAAITGEVRAEITRTRALEWAQRRRLARALHGPVQSAITAAAIRLERSQSPGSLEAVDIETLRADILDAINAMDTGYSADFLAGFDRIRRTWQGVCAIELSGDFPVERLGPSPCTEALLEIIGEACGNAARHGRASAVDVNVARTDLSDCLALRIADNGSLRSDQDGSAGMGSKIIDELTITWERRITDDSCVLRATLPVELATTCEA